MHSHNRKVLNEIVQCYPICEKARALSDITHIPHYSNDNFYFIFTK